MSPADDEWIQRIRARVQLLSDRQHGVERHLARGLSVDHSGLMVMNVLVGSGPRTPTQLAENLNISTATTSLVLQRLEAAGHIERSEHPNDRRKVVISATPGSTEAVTDLIDPLVSGIARIVSGMDTDQRQAVERFLDDLAALYADIASE